VRSSALLKKRSMSRGAQYRTGIFSDSCGGKYHFRLYRRYYEVNLLPYDDVLPCLNELEGRRLGIMSNGDLKEQGQISKIVFM
jgi:FMN phosphatase YigB (HAD superfamily)